MKTKITAVIFSIIVLASTVLAQSKLANLSTRGYVGSGDLVLIAGGIITGDSYKNIIVRALGPSLSGFGVSGALADPVLEIHDGSGSLIATNDDWQDDQYASTVQAYGLEPNYSAESAIYGYVPPGAYTVVVTGFQGSTGVGLVEIYDVD